MSEEKKTLTPREFVLWFKAFVAARSFDSRGRPTSPTHNLKGAQLEAILKMLEATYIGEFE